VAIAQSRRVMVLHFIVVMICEMLTVLLYLTGIMGAGRRWILYSIDEKVERTGSVCVLIMVLDM
jgi:hypothetical protein